MPKFGTDSVASCPTSIEALPLCSKMPISAAWLADTLIVAMGEFGRTPAINKDAGRDHWGPAASLLFAGAGVRGGLLLGATDRRGAYVTRRPIAPADVASTIYDAIGVDPHQWLMHPEGRPIEILDRGEPVRELFA